MSTRSPRWAPKTRAWLVRPSWPRTSQCRFNSTVPERLRKLPNTKRSAFSYILHKWLLTPFIWAAPFVAGWGLNSYVKSSNGSSFVAYTLTAKEPVSSTASIFHLKPQEQSQNYELYKEAWRKGIWNVEFKQPQLQIVRAYTPLPPAQGSKEQDAQDLRFLIRHDPHGEVSSYLHRLPSGAAMEVRGPFLEYEITPSVRQVVFFAGGTGIAPALQVAHALFGDEEGTSANKSANDRHLHILWASRSREDCKGGVSDDSAIGAKHAGSTWSNLFSTSKPEAPNDAEMAQKGVIVEELEALKRKYPGQVRVDYFVNAEDTWIDERAVSRAVMQLNEKSSALQADTPGSRQILISGPPGFIAHLAGPKVWQNGREEQGPVSKLVAHALAKSPYHVKVWKI